MPGMSPPGGWRRRSAYWPELLIGVIALGARWVPAPRTIDDAFITFRYARNLLAGHGFVFNLGERVLGTTTPLYTLLLAGLAGVTRSVDYPWLALLVNSVADLFACLLLVGLGRRLTGSGAVGLALGGLWAIAPMSVTFAVGGMETSLFVLLLVAAAVAYLDRRTRLAAALAALVLLTRPDGALLVGPLAVDLCARRLRARAARAGRAFPWVEAAVFLAVLAPWLLFATVYFGSPIPHSIAAKSLAYRLPPEAAFVRLLQHYGTPFFEHEAFGPAWPLFGLAYLWLSLIGVAVVIRRDPAAWPVAAFPYIYFLAYALANPLIFRWYLTPPLPIYLLLILAGLHRLAGDVARRLRPSGPQSLAAWGLALPVALFAGLSLAQWTLQPDHGPARPAPRMAWHQLELYYTRVGQSLRPAVTPATVVAAGDVGALAYYSGARILDTVGLMSPAAAAYYPLDPGNYVINYAIPPRLILDQQPDYVVLLEVYGRAGLLPDPAFQAAYTLAETIPTDIYGSQGLLIYRRTAGAR
jgi:hypothetical protein